MNQPFVTLGHLSLSSTTEENREINSFKNKKKKERKTEENTSLVLPRTFLALNLRHIALRGIRLPKRLRLLTSTSLLVTLSLTHTRASGYFCPRLLVARLQPLLQLEELSICFTVPLPRPSAEGELLNKRGTPVTLRNLKHLTFVGVSAYLESLLAQIETPFLERLNVKLFMQMDFALLHLSRFISVTEKIKSDFLVVTFGHNAVSITTRSGTPADERIVLSVRCRQLDWQIECAAQV